VNIIEIKNISFSYSGKIKALDDVSLSIAENKITGLLGPNGGGKTTLFKIISSLIRSYEGEVSIAGIGQKTNLSKYLSHLGVVFQSPSLDKKLTVEENLLYHANLYGISSANIQSRMDSLLTSMSILDRKRDLVAHLSGGLARRVEIVKSLLHSPKILLLDEPSTGLDIAIRIDLWNLLKKIQREQGITILLTTHFIEEADRCDQIALLNQGKIVSVGSPQQLKDQLTFKHFQIKPKNADTVMSLLKDKFNVSVQQENGFLQFQIDPAKALDVSAQLSSHVEELNYRDPSLEDVFIQQTGRKL
jgi:ABC-2 type transport system ATP-binding protein